MTHNYYRIPVRCRLKALNESLPNEPEILKRSKCRRHRRKLRFLLNLFELRQNKIGGVWMETHIWHAKRFKMETRWGVRYPIRCSDKSDRSTYRLVQRDSACIMDKSYYSTFELSFESVELLTAFCRDAFKITVSSESTDLAPVYRKVLLNEQSNAHLIAPVEILILKNKLFVTVHPSAAKQALAELRKLYETVNRKVENRFINRFTIFSKQASLQHIFNVLEPLVSDASSKKTMEYL